MRPRAVAFAVVASFVLAVTASAQNQQGQNQGGNSPSSPLLSSSTPQLQSGQQHFTFVGGGSVSAYGYSVGPYSGLMGTQGNQTPVILNCVDFFHSVHAGEQWDANLTSLSTGTGIGTNTRSSSLSLYREAAYLSTLYGTAGNNNTDVANIQISIWNLFGNTGLAYKSGGNQTGSYWMRQATTNYASLNTTGYYVVTDINKNQSGSAQEFLMYNPPTTTVTPEPATLVLFGTGFVGLAGVRLRRRRSQKS